MKYRFISFRTYGTGSVQDEKKAFISEDRGALIESFCRGARLLWANDHDRITVHETCDAEDAKRWNISICRV